MANLLGGFCVLRHTSLEGPPGKALREPVFSGQRLNPETAVQ